MNEQAIGFQTSVLLHLIIVGAVAAISMSEVKISRPIEIDFGFVKEEAPKVAAQAAPERKEVAGTVPRRQSAERAVSQPLAQKDSPVSAPQPAGHAGPKSAASGNAAGPGPAAHRIVDNVRFGSAAGPNFVRREIPEYPFAAKRMNKEGRVLLKLTIDERGKLLHVEVVEAAGFGFTESAVEAVRKSTYRPAVLNGRPVLSKALLPVRFRLAMQHNT
jgi:protein TonB